MPAAAPIHTSHDRALSVLRTNPRRCAHQVYVTGSCSSERWGQLLRYTKFLSDDAQAVFVRQYTAMTFSNRLEPHDTNTQRNKP